MAPKTKKMALADMLEDLAKDNFEKFCHNLLDRRAEPRVRRKRVEGKSYLEIADVLVSTFTEDGAVTVAVEILNQIACQGEAKELEKEAGGQSSKPGASDTAVPSAGATAVNTMVDVKHFVDKHRVKLIERVSSVTPILDELLDQDVLKQEKYDEIRALSTTQDKMREIYKCLNTKAGKDIFYRYLEKNEKHLMEELKAQQ